MKQRSSLSRRRLATDIAGLAFVEYVILLVLIAALSTIAFRAFGDAVQNEVRSATDAIRTLR